MVNGCCWLNHSSKNTGKFIDLVRKNPCIKAWFSGHFHLGQVLYIVHRTIVRVLCVVWCPSPRPFAHPPPLVTPTPRHAPYDPLLYACVCVSLCTDLRQDYEDSITFPDNKADRGSCVFAQTAVMGKVTPPLPPQSISPYLSPSI